VISESPTCPNERESADLGVVDKLRHGAERLAQPDRVACQVSQELALPVW
jgi:hypothetical protein